MKILIVDDNESDRKLFKVFLQNAGFKGEILMATTGEESLEMIQPHAPDLVILDTRMPGIDGFETCRGIKASAQTPIKVIMVTGLVDAVDAGKAREAGADGYCVKTSDGANLIETIKEIGLNINE